MKQEFESLPELQCSDEVIKRKFKNLKTFSDVSNLLEITPKHLHYIMFKMPNKYKKFKIPKKTGGFREISAPNISLKILQQKLNHILSLHYNPRFTSHGFINGKSIVTNAQQHVKQNYILNLDIEDFFNSINFGRIRGILASFFGISNVAATTIANICCYNNSLPQGAPTSPILSNMICFKLDKEMHSLAKKHSCIYTRYADDLSFSTSKNYLPISLAYKEEGTYKLSSNITKILDENGFVAKNSKTRVTNRNQRMEVTGLTVNEKPNVRRKYIRNIRAIIRSIEKYGKEPAQEILEDKYNKSYLKSPPKIENLLVGKLNYLKMVRGKEDPVFNKLAKRLNKALGEKLIDTYKSKEDLRNLYTYVVECGMLDEGVFYEEPGAQGTGFFLSGVGFITNAHVVEEYKKLNNTDIPYEIRLHRSRYSDTSITAQLVKYNRDLDIAILKVKEFDINYGYSYNTENEIGQKIRVMGYPNHNKRDSLGTDSGEIKQYRDNYLKETFNYKTGKLGSFQERFIVSARIVDGNSGGPVLNDSDEVIGIATKGFRTLTDNGLDEDSDTSIVVKIEDVLQMKKTHDYT
ncbi:reverse transcriptase domain-containing protein [Halobacillus sp. H74]|uniref:reverse transcriptase domain-containing protein n=1 Tax=Halobacillus sp. H74 TaxID=3457436 RepID=UPI003FCD9FEC